MGRDPKLYWGLEPTICPHATVTTDYANTWCGRLVIDYYDTTVTGIDYHTDNPRIHNGALTDVGNGVFTNITY